MKFNLTRPNNGMTLIELVVVLGILAALAGMTLSFVGEMNSAARQTVTRNKLEQIENAIIGNNTQNSRFLNDMGRLPVMIHDNNKDNSGIILSELWDSELFDRKTNDPVILYNGYNDEITNTKKLNKPEGIIVTLSGGWKGSYLNVTNKKLYDGFGNDFHAANPKSDNPIQNWDNFDEIEEEFTVVLPNTTTILNIPEKTILKFGSFGEDDQFDDTSQKTSTATAWQNADDIKKFHYSQVFATLRVNILLRDSSTTPATWQPPLQVKEYPTNDNVKAYDPNTIYKTGSLIKDSNDDLYVCTSDHSATTPSDNEPIVWKRNETFIDKAGREWVWLPRTNGLNRLRVTVFFPYVETEPTNNTLKKTIARAVTALYPDPDKISPNLFYFYPDTTNAPIEWNKIEPDNFLPIVEIQGDTMNEITFRNLIPGIRKIFAYGFAECEIVDNATSTTKYSNARHSNVQTIELKPGENFITIYLRESF
ncbi:MAG: type II secretion system GspH family protein [Planctomycetaceae bacterium]|jgi:prepilin-type N-terminal cleavage/methylation domain-containing protein|nr:type II secretion system GspH family protein [Planctomycetaceae bacterium]